MNNTLTQISTQTGITINGIVNDNHLKVLTLDAMSFLRELHENFNDKIDEVLKARHERQKQIDSGETPDFMESTALVREGEWTIAPFNKDLQDRRVEITGPVDRKMVINALNSGANVFMADFEDSNSPTWRNNIDGQVNLIDAIDRTITFVNPQRKQYTLHEKPAILFVRPRGFHLKEKSLLIRETQIYGCLMDFGLYFFHNAKKLISLGNGPYFYLPKLQSHIEARLWNDIFNFSQDYLQIPRGTVKATVLIEHILAAFELEEILYELREHSAGLNCGRWDYIFSFIKTFSKKSEFILPDRDQVGMTVHFLSSYVDLLIQVCHKRGAHAMGGMAAQIPIKNDPEANELAVNKVKMDKEREVKAGHDGTWVAHPGLIDVAKNVFNEYMKTPNQIHIPKKHRMIKAEDLLKVPRGTITEGGVRKNINVGIKYLAAWLSGNGCVPIYNLMEDAATAEISRSQLWQWVHHSVKLDDGRILTIDLFKEFLASEMQSIEKEVRAGFQIGNFETAASLFNELTLGSDLEEFLTLKSYSYLK